MDGEEKTGDAGFAFFLDTGSATAIGSGACAGAGLMPFPVAFEESGYDFFFGGNALTGAFTGALTGATALVIFLGVAGMREGLAGFFEVAMRLRVDDILWGPES